MVPASLSPENLLPKPIKAAIEYKSAPKIAMDHSQEISLLIEVPSQLRHPEPVVRELEVKLDRQLKEAEEEIANLKILLKLYEEQSPEKAA